MASFPGFRSCLISYWVVESTYTSISLWLWLWLDILNSLIWRIATWYCELNQTLSPISYSLLGYLILATENKQRQMHSSQNYLPFCRLFLHLLFPLLYRNFFIFFHLFFSHTVHPEPSWFFMRFRLSIVLISLVTIFVGLFLYFFPSSSEFQVFL